MILLDRSFFFFFFGAMKAEIQVGRMPRDTGLWGPCNLGKLSEWGATMMSVAHWQRLQCCITITNNGAKADASFQGF